jgi:hypothetical protein
MQIFQHLRLRIDIEFRQGAVSDWIDQGTLQKDKFKASN